MRLFEQYSSRRRRWFKQFLLFLDITKLTGKIFEEKILQKWLIKAYLHKQS